MLDEIYKVAAVFACPGEDDRETLRTLCTAAETELSASLRKDVRPEDCRGSFLCAAAMLAASHYIAARSVTPYKSFTVGEVTVTSGGENRSASELRTQAELLMRPFCTGGRFFLGVRS